MSGLTIERARQAAVLGQALAGPRPASVVDAVKRLTRLQIDPVRAVARAERLVLWSRLGRYDVDDLHRAAFRDHELFEYRAFFLPMADLPLYQGMMRRWRIGGRALPAGLDGAESRRARTWVAANSDFRRYVLRELSRRGPLRSRDLEDRAAVPWRSNGWNDGKNLSRMLEFLLNGGELAVCDRHGNERIWDLARRHRPAGLPRLTTPQATRELLRRQLRARGVARDTEIGWQLDAIRLPGWERALASLVREGVAEPVQIAGLPGRWYAAAEVLAAPFEPRTTLLSPFDRLIHDRDRTELLFGFRYRLEMYVPREQRDYGYYVLPVLDGDRLAGRVDASFRPGSSVLAVDAVFAEDGAAPDTGRRLGPALLDLAGWLGAGTILLGDRLPPAWAPALRAALS